MRQYSGAVVRRVIDRSHTGVPEHAHDWPVISVFVIGSYLNETEAGRRFISTPSVVFYHAGAAHRNTVGADGFEQLEIEFDPSWLGRSFLPVAPVRRWGGGDAIRLSHSLMQACRSEEALRESLRRGLMGRDTEIPRERPDWLLAVERRLREDPAITVKDLAREVRRHPSWLGYAYRRATGEGLRSTAARLRAERAACLLRETDQPLAHVALEAGFCDQSHLNRTLHRVLGRSPAAVREERCRFRDITCLA
jgi:AraC family transcriptional regulator